MLGCALDKPPRARHRGMGRRACGIPSSGGLFPAGVSRRRAFDIVCLTAIFLILALVSALRLEVGNDYGKYVENFHEIWAGTDQAYVVTEAGFNFVVWLIYTISGYENYLLVFAVFGAVTAFLFLKALYEQSDCFWQSFAMFMLLGVYFRTFTTVRYYLALAGSAVWNPVCTAQAVWLFRDLDWHCGAVS